MGLLPTVLISVLFPGLMLLITVALGRMEEFLLPHLRAPLPSEGDGDTPSQSAPPKDSRGSRTADPAAEDDAPTENLRPEEIRIAKARADDVRRSARRRAYGTPRPVGRTNTGPPRGARTTPLRFR